MAGRSVSDRFVPVLNEAAQLRATNILAAGDYIKSASSYNLIGQLGIIAFGNVWIDPEEWDVYLREARTLLRFTHRTNDVGAAVNCYFELHEVTGMAGLSGSSTITTVPVVGSRTQTHAMPPANSFAGPYLSPRFRLDHAGFYAPVAHLDGAFALNAVSMVTTEILAVSD